jgi:hypothetical protein
MRSFRMDDERWDSLRNEATARGFDSAGAFILRAIEESLTKPAPDGSAEQTKDEGRRHEHGEYRSGYNDGFDRALVLLNEQVAAIVKPVL